jgi:hypothetical protein
LESFEILPIEYGFVCDGGIFGEPVFTRLTGGIYMLVIDPSRADGLSHEQAYYDMIRLLENGEATVLRPSWIATRPRGVKRYSQLISRDIVDSG